MVVIKVAQIKSLTDWKEPLIISLKRPKHLEWLISLTLVGEFDIRLEEENVSLVIGIRSQSDAI